MCEQFAIDGIITYWLLNWNQSQPVAGSRCTAAVERLGLSEFKYAERVHLLPTRRYASTVLLWSGVCVCLSVTSRSSMKTAILPCAVRNSGISENYKVLLSAPNSELRKFRHGT